MVSCVWVVFVNEKIVGLRVRKRQLGCLSEEHFDQGSDEDQNICTPGG
jgi:hypothetical protein